MESSHSDSPQEQYSQPSTSTFPEASSLDAMQDKCVKRKRTKRKSKVFDDVADSNKQLNDTVDFSPQTISPKKSTLTGDAEKSTMSDSVAPNIELTRTFETSHSDTTKKKSSTKVTTGFRKRKDSNKKTVRSRNVPEMDSSESRTSELVDIPASKKRNSLKNIAGATNVNKNNVVKSKLTNEAESKSIYKVTEENSQCSGKTKITKKRILKTIPTIINDIESNNDKQEVPQISFKMSESITEPIKKVKIIDNSVSFVKHDPCNTQREHKTKETLTISKKHKKCKTSKIDPQNGTISSVALENDSGLSTEHENHSEMLNNASSSHNQRKTNLQEKPHSSKSIVNTKTEESNNTKPLDLQKNKGSRNKSRTNDFTSDVNQLQTEIQNTNNSESSLNVTTTFNTNESLTESVTSLIPFTSTPKIRTRKKNDALVNNTPMTDESNEVKETSQRKTSRKRTVITYAMDDSDDDLIMRKKRKTQAKVVERLDSSEDVKVTVKSELIEGNSEALSDSVRHANAETQFKGRGRSPKKRHNDDTDTRVGKRLKVRDDLITIVTCAVCKEEMSISNWNTHLLRRHNNLAWREGEAPLDLNDQRLVLRVLNSIYKKKLPLHCDTCGEVKKSVGGLLSHKTVCSKSLQEVAALRVKCEFCDRTVMPVSMSAHLKYCKGTDSPLVDRYVTTSNLNKNKSLIVDKSKRLAAVKADNLIQNLNQEDPDNSSYWQAWFKNKEFWLSPELLTRIRNDIDRFGTEKCDVEGCSFLSNNAVSFAQHYQTCIINSEEDLYVCKYCVTVRDSEESVLNHVKSSHRIKKRDDGNFEVSEVPEEIDEDDLLITESNKKNIPVHAVRLTVCGIKFLYQNRYCAASTNILYPPAYDWTLNFYRQHFSTLNLFPEWKVPCDSLKILDNNTVCKYLPSLMYSASINRISTEKFVDPVRLDHVWKRYKLFESEICDDGTVTIFCGGQIFAMAWLPTPFDQKNIVQVLAISTSSSSMDKVFLLDEVYCDRDLIQFWNFGTLKNDDNIINAPKLDFCIALDYGPVRCLEWCPSGCYDCESDQGFLKRLGLLAVGCTNSQIYIYSVSHDEQNSGKIFKPKPVLKLLLEAKLEEPTYGVEAHVTKISWSKASGHQVIAAGYANGFVAVFDLKIESTLLKLKPQSDGVKILLPYRIFKAHYHAVTALHLSYLGNGKRWLMSASTDRAIKYWDLENVVIPLANFPKSNVTDGVWVNHWLSSIHSCDDCCGSAPTTSIIYQPRNFVSEHSSTMYSNCHVCSIAGSEWLNGFIQGNVMGELQGYFPHQLFAGMDNDKSKSKKKVMLGYVDIVEKDLSIHERIAAAVKRNITPKANTTTDSLNGINDINDVTNLIKAEPLSYKEAIEKYGVVFCDINTKFFKQCHENMTNYTQSKSSKFYNPQPNIYPLQSINKVVFNPNHSSYLHVAAAYQIGFVRVSRLGFLKK